MNESQREIKKHKHEWGTDGVHSNVFCKKCFKTYTHEDVMHDLAKKMKPHLHIKT